MRRIFNNSTAIAVGVALLMSVKPLCWLFTGQSFSSACRECNLFALFRRNPSKQTPAS